MKKTIKILMIVGITLFVLGIICIMVGAFNGGFEKQSFESKEFEITDTFDKMDIEVHIGTCKVKYYDGTNVKVQYDESKKITTKVEVKDKTLKINAAMFTNKFNINSFLDIYDAPETIVLIPNKMILDLNIDVYTGMLLIGEDTYDQFTYGNLDLTVHTGQIRLTNMQCDNIKAVVNTGSISLTSICCSKCDVEVKTGSFNATLLDAMDSDIKVTTGSARINMAYNKKEFEIKVKKSNGSCNVEDYTSDTASRNLNIDVSTGSVNVSFGGAE